MVPYEPDRYTFGELVKHPGEMIGNAVNRFETLRKINNGISEVPCKLSDKHCPYVRPPFVTDCNRTCESQFGSQWRSEGQFPHFCPLFGGVRQKCKNMN